MVTYTKISPKMMNPRDIWGEIFAYVIFFNPVMEVVTLRLHGCYMLGVFLLLAFACLGSFASMRWNAYMHKLDLG